MGAYRFPDDELNDDLGIIRTADSTFIENDDAAPAGEQNQDWADYLIWLAVPNTPDVATATAIADIRDRHKSLMDHEGDAEFLKDLLVAKGGAAQHAPALFALFRTYQEAILWERKVWAQIHVEGNATTQTVVTDTFEPFEHFDTDDHASANASAAQASDKVVTGRKGVYRLAAHADIMSNFPGQDLSIQITVGGTQVPGSRATVRATAGSELHHLSVAVLDEIASDDQDVKLEIASSGNANLTVENATLSICKEAELDDATNYPVLDALEPNQGASIDAVAEAMVTEWEGIATRVGDTEDVRRDAHDDIDAAGTKAAVEAIDPTWPA